MLQRRTYISTGERIRNYLAAGFALSLMLNALFTPLYPDLKEQVERVKSHTITIIHLLHLTPPPQPTPPPRKVTQRAHAAARPLAVHPPRISRASVPAAPPYVAPSGAIDTGIPGAHGSAPASTATSGATVGPACSNPNVDASVIDAMSPAYPDSAREQGLGDVSVLVQVTIDAQGRLIDARIAQSSHNLAIDQAALRAARLTTYEPRIVNCVPTQGTYLFHADFSSD